MKFRVTQSILIEAESYEAVGRLLDSIDKHTQTAFIQTDMNGKHDFTGFDTKPCKAAMFDEAQPPFPERSDF